MAEMWPTFQTSGIFHSFRDLVKINCSGSNIDFLHSFTNLGCMLFWPFDLVALILSIASDILSVEMSVEHRGSANGRSGKSGSPPVPSFSNTLEKNELRTFAFS